MMRRTIDAFLLSLLASGVSAQQAPPPVPSQTPTLLISRVSEPPRLEDFLDGSPPAGFTAITGFVQREPGDGVPASQKTTAYISYDDDRLHIVFVCEDTQPDQMRARLARREDISGDDSVALVLDTFHDRRRSYLFIVNAHGIQLDGIVSEGQEDDYSFDTLWKSEGRRTPSGYAVRIELPFRSLRFPAAEKQTWGIAVARVIPRTNETVFWPYITRRVAGFGQQLATLEGLERISPGRNMQLIPYGVFAGARQFEPAPPGGRYATDSDARVGLDGKIVIKDAFTLDLALNPDFSQIESDEPQVTINQRFEVFFPERRPFFIENATYFETPIQLVFSRRIADPQFGARVTGKTGGWALGALTIDDRAAGRQLPPQDPAFGDRAGIGIVRAQRDFGEQSSLGVLATSRDFAGTFSRVASADGRWKVNDNWVAQGQIAVSQTREADSAESGTAAFAEVIRDSRTFSWGMSYLDISPEFRVPLGFVRRVDTRQIEQQMEYNWRPDGKAVLRYGPEFSMLANWDYAGRLQDWEINPEFDLELTRQTYFFVGHEQSMELFEGIEFRKHSTDVSFQSDWFTWLSGGAGLAWGTEVNFFPGEGARPYLASGREAEVNVTVRPGSQLRLQQSYLYSGLSTRDTGSTIFTNHILRSRLTYQFTRSLSMRAIVDYEAVRPNAGLVDLEDERQLTGDVLFTWLLNPGTAVYVGYTDRYERFDPFEEPSDDRRPSRLRSTGRQVFVKASYLFRF
jgi:hypothetical protein